MLRKRIWTAVVLIPLVVALILLAPSGWVALALAGVLLLGAWEWAALVGFTGPANRGAFVVLTAVVLVGVFLLQPDRTVITGILVVAVGWWLGMSAMLGQIAHRPPGWMRALAGVMTLVPAWVALIMLHAGGPRGREFFLFLLLLVWAADIGAYLVGRLVGRHKLAPRVSPGKTWEGLAGGVAASGLVAIAGGVWFGLPLLKFVILAVLIATFSVVGDLSESFFKRQAGLKDSGTLLPGHGGVLDRIDSLTAAAPLFLLGLMLLGWVR
ncbi:MAG: CDP-archaeol synthase [Gammaproteobacteria bacterium]|jgi:phosphatidate cytidylyltransferase